MRLRGDPGGYVLDSFALVALFQAEPGGERVRQLLDDARDGRSVVAMSLINWGEFLYITQRGRGPEARAGLIAIVDAMPIELVGVSRDAVLNAAALKADFRLSYADCYAAALAQERDAAVVTGDPEFRALEPQLRIEWLPQRTR